MKTTEAVKGKESIILSHYGLPPITGNRHYKGECPLCGKRNKFRISQQGERFGYICVCGNGSLFKLLQEFTGKEFRTLASEVDQIIGNTTILKREPQKESKLQKTLSRWREIKSLRGTDAETYLKSRGICELPSQGIKYSNGEWEHKEQRKIPCMMAIASDNQGNAVYTHKTYIENGQKAQIETQKKLEGLGMLEPECDKCGAKTPVSCAVKLFPCDDVLGISEGIESALSCKQLFGVNTWSVLNSSIMKKFRAPDGVKHLIIYADNDANGTGLAAAFECASQNIKQSKTLQRVTVKWTEQKDTDFNDMLNNPMQCYEWILDK